jgi:hypothetical protein
MKLFIKNETKSTRAVLAEAIFWRLATGQGDLDYSTPGCSIEKSKISRFGVAISAGFDA